MHSIYPINDRSAWIRALRPPRSPVNPFKPIACFLEQERSAEGRIVDSSVFLLASKECPWTCLMCDLWKHTTISPMPPGAIVRQIQCGLEQLGTQTEQVKLYNSGSFFDAAAIPVSEYDGIAKNLNFAKHVIVESHPRLIGTRTQKLHEILSGSLEVAMGLETVHPTILPRLNKNFKLEDFAAATEFLLKEAIKVRAFVLIKPPFMPENEIVEWSVRSATFAFSCGVTSVSLIPTRIGNGALEALMAAGEFSMPRLVTIEAAFNEVLALRLGRTFIDTWDLEKFASCPICVEQRRQRLHWMNLHQTFSPVIYCSRCQG